ncbi:MAG: glucose-1-phosphate adenylyltransferase, partial [Proteobacteria bacterium]|nr:glucose-1-phosphate adenylyltransferase [Pseudomonadota bacterium]
HSYCLIEDSVILADTDISRHCRLRKVIVDTNCKIPSNFVAGEDPEADAKRFFRTPGGITVISQAMLDAL